MPRRFVFADECGNFDFARKPGASKFFILVTLCVADCTVGDALLTLRRELAWERMSLASEFHATTDEQKIRDRVFATIEPYNFRVDATILDKAKAQPQIRQTDERFYQTAWFLHMKFLAPRLVGADDELLVVGASLGTKRKRATFHSAITDVIQQVSSDLELSGCQLGRRERPLPPVADYCAWAIQRKWEQGDTRSYGLIERKVATEFAPFELGPVDYY